MILLDVKDKVFILKNTIDSLETILKGKCKYLCCEETGSLVDLSKLGAKEFNEELFKVVGEQGYWLVWDKKENRIYLQGKENKAILDIPYDLLDEYAVDKLMYGVGALLSLNLIHDYK